MSSLFSQKLSRFDSPEEAFVLRLTGDRVSSGADGLASGGSFMPGISAHYYTGHWGLGAEYASFNNDPSFDIPAYLKNIQAFTVHDIIASEWRTRSLLAGISYRVTLGAGLYAAADLFGGMVRIKSPAYTIKDGTDGTLIADTYYETKATTSADKALFAVKPVLRLEWHPENGAIGLNIHASYLQATGAEEVSAYHRDLSKVRFENASQQEIRTQVLNAPMIETRSKGPVNNLAFGAGISLKIATRQGRQTQGKTFGEKVNAGLQRGIIHRDLAARNIISGRLAVRSGNGDMGIITNETSGDAGASLGRENSMPLLSFTAASIVAREAGSGLSTGRTNGNTATANEVSNVNEVSTARMFRPVYDDGRKDPPIHDSPIVAVVVNPLYTPHQGGGSNPMHDAKNRVAENPLYEGNGNAGQNPLATVVNPLYTPHQASGSNPLHEGKNRVAGNPLYEASGNAGQNPLAEGIVGVNIVLVDEATGEILATTVTEQGGDFFFANVPDGQYALRVMGSASFQKGYDVHARKEVDIAGVIRQGISQVILTVATETTNDTLTPSQARRRVEVLKSNKTGPISGRMNRPLKTYFETGDSPTSDQAARPGSPIGGIVVKGGKNPGGNLFTTTTDNNGRFEANNLKEGNYTLIFEQTIYFRDEVKVVLSGGGAR